MRRSPQTSRAAWIKKPALMVGQDTHRLAGHPAAVPPALTPRPMGVHGPMGQDANRRTIMAPLAALPGCLERNMCPVTSEKMEPMFARITGASDEVSAEMACSVLAGDVFGGIRWP